MRSILLDRDELAWLVSIYEDMVVMEDSRVFWNQSQPGFLGLLINVALTDMVVFWWLRNLSVIEEVGRCLF
jgi:hypothetical protein